MYVYMIVCTCIYIYIYLDFTNLNLCYFYMCWFLRTAVPVHQAIGTVKRLFQQQRFGSREGASKSRKWQRTYHVYIPWTRDRPLLAKRSCFDMGHFEMFKIRPCVQNTAFSVFTENWRFSSVRQFGIFFSPKPPFLYTYVFRANQPLLECITLAKAWSWLPHCQNKSSIIIMKSNWKTFEGAQIKTFENISHQIGVSIHATVIYHGSFQTCLNLNQASPQKASVSLPNVRHSWNFTWLSYKVLLLLAWCSQRWHHPWRSGSDTAQLQSRCVQPCVPLGKAGTASCQPPPTTLPSMHSAQGRSTAT